MIRHLTVSAIILRDEHVLLIEHRKSGLFLPPGGHLNDHELPTDAIHREVMEEVGLTVEILAKKQFSHPAVATLEPPFTILVIDNVADPTVGPHTHIDLVYVCRPTSSHVTLNPNEVDGYHWVALADVADLPTPPELPSLILTAAKYAETAEF
ncbi:NUDIX hydrolase [Catellatospora chokoriensis]|uniref:NUDIX hydrolase n=1 Tax=Catellatospora chokoriensis TaxID=310353 RepID=A0A8J3K0Y2_9ACTN|nr:NUDIX domain-containing protein [Catellatospora chokoriensis]GIF94652.1 NUDIX hydrolase [Catellatospora chokoriensis]